MDSRIPKIDNIDKFNIFFSTKEDGNMIRTNENREYAHQTRINFLKKCGVDLNYFARVRPTDSPNVEIVKMSNNTIVKKVFLKQAIIEADFDFYYDGSDGIFSLQKNVSVGLMSGDCVPLVIWDNVSGLHGIFHIGLLGALNGIVTNIPTILKVVKADLENLNFYMGPSIAVDDYCLSTSGLWKAIKIQVENKLPYFYNFTVIKGENYYFDIQKFIIKQLVDIGVDFNKIQAYPYSTADKDSIFFSHHKAKYQDNNIENGRFYSLIISK